MAYYALRMAQIVCIQSAVVGADAPRHIAFGGAIRWSVQLLCYFFPDRRLAWANLRVHFLRPSPRRRSSDQQTLAVSPDGQFGTQTVPRVGGQTAVRSLQPRAYF